MDIIVLFIVLLAVPKADGKCQPLLMCPSFCMTVKDGCYACDCGSFNSFMQHATLNMDQIEKGQGSQTGTQLSTYTSGYSGTDMGLGRLLSPQTGVESMIRPGVGSSGNVQSLGLNKLPFAAPDVQQQNSAMIRYNGMSPQMAPMPGMNCPPMGNLCPSSCWSTDVLTGCIKCSCEMNVANSIKPKSTTSPVTAQNNSNSESTHAVLRPTLQVPTRPPASKNNMSIEPTTSTVHPSLKGTFSTKQVNQQIPFAQTIYPTLKQPFDNLSTQTANAQKQQTPVSPTRKWHHFSTALIPFSTKEPFETNEVLEKPFTPNSSLIIKTYPMTGPTNTILLSEADTMITAFPPSPVHRLTSNSATTTTALSRAHPSRPTDTILFREADSTKTSSVSLIPSQRSSPHSFPTTTILSNTDPLVAAIPLDTLGNTDHNNNKNAINHSGMGFYNNSNSGKG
ncbi:integrator complex subunit 6 homolog isoform X2 [Dreissena polymorpha]|uniref:Uncharacterized protein n=1 Tax=Dreissena polymorpha TaxID=45954 RepID=A0A9D4H6P1_DREPO|nr:integrator complex subunit 6 homolog isoform X2 [Dreissena polymorpha]KAH3830589.1 hypothetical protein DPMN_103834 [Dreissena polymorpha]